MSAVVDIRQFQEAKANGVFAKVNIKARQMGYSGVLALRVAQRARDAYRKGGSAQGAVAAAEARLRTLGGGDAA